MTNPTKAQTFQCAFAVYEQALYPLQPTEQSIINLSLAVDRMVQFGISRDLAVTFIFSDGSRAIVAPRQTTTH